jgi:hypothetical protein
MAASARTPALPEGARVGALSALLRQSQFACAATFCSAAARSDLVAAGEAFTRHRDLLIHNAGEGPLRSICKTRRLSVCGCASVPRRPHGVRRMTMSDAAPETSTPARRFSDSITVSGRSLRTQRRASLESHRRRPACALRQRKSIACRWAKLGARSLTRYGLLEPSDTR